MRKQDQKQLLQLGMLLFRRLPFPVAVTAVAVVVIVVVLIAAAGKKPSTNGDPSPGTVPEASADGYLFCFWNVENLFDDQDDRRVSADEKYDNDFANDAELRNTKLRNLSKVLVAMNAGKGPDILALAEIESDRAAELLQDQLNKDLPSDAAPYSNRLFIEQKQGRHIAPAILTRLPVKGNRTAQLGKRSQRILRGQIDAGGHQLTVIASHWKSRIQKPGAVHTDEEGREDYADVIYGEFKAMCSNNPDADVLVCGDFNDDPDDDSVVKHLRATGERSPLTSGTDPLLFNLAAGKSLGEFGSEYHNRWHLFDQIAVSPGLLDDKGWTCNPDSFKTMREKMSNRRGHPWRFTEDDHGKRTRDNVERGFSDHFPVTVRLKVRD